MAATARDVGPGDVVAGVVQGRWRASLAYALDVALWRPARVRLVCGSDVDDLVLHAPVPVERRPGRSWDVLARVCGSAGLVVVERDPDEVDGWGAGLASLRRATACPLVEVDDRLRVLRVSGPRVERLAGG